MSDTNDSKPLTPSDIRQTGIAYMIELAANRDENDEVKPEAAALMHRTAAILNDPEAVKGLAAELNADAAEKASPSS
jgi:hypothetical protein